jgi:hypothetical protein
MAGPCGPFLAGYPGTAWPFKLGSRPQPSIGAPSPLLGGEADIPDIPYRRPPMTLSGHYADSLLGRHMRPRQ